MSLSLVYCSHHLMTRCCSLLAVLLFLATWPVSAQDGGSAPGVPVRGVVVNSITGQGVPRALVVLSGDLATMTGGDGQFSFDSVPVGQYLVSVSKPGYQGFGNTGGSRGPRVVHGASTWVETAPRHLQVGPEMPSVTFRIAPSAAIVGIVTLSTSDPADGIALNLYRQQIQFGHPTWSAAGHATTRSDGSFRFGNLPPGSYMLETSASLDSPEPNAASRLPVWGYPPVYYPGVTDPGSAGVITLAAGQQAEADLSVTRQAFYPVMAAVRSPEGRMAANFEIVDAGGNTTGLPAHFDAREQAVHANVPNGTWMLEGRLYGREMAAGVAQFQVASAPVSLALNMAQMPRIPVNLRRELTSTTAPTAAGAGVNLMLRRADSFGSNGVGFGMSQVPGSEGTAWTLNVIEPGRYWVVASPWANLYVSSITSGGTDLASNPLVVMPGSSVAPIDVTLRDDLGSIAGQIQSGSGGATTSAVLGDTPVIRVYAIPLFPTVQPMPEGLVQSDGSFTVNNVPPGSYRVVACDETPQINFHRPEDLAVWAGKGQTVTVDAGGSAHVTLDVVHVQGGSAEGNP